MAKDPTSSGNRDEFSSGVKSILASRAGFRCSKPDCRALTIGPSTVNPGAQTNIGVAAHITAASPGGPRYDPTLTPEERRSVANGIWTCQNHGKQIDDDVVQFGLRSIQELSLRINLIEVSTPLWGFNGWLVVNDRYMDITVSHEQGRVPITVFRIKGDIDVNSYEQLQAQARQAYEAGARDLVLDLTDTAYVSSAGIRAINSIFKLLRSDAPNESDEAMRKGLSDGTFKSPHLKLVNPSSHVHEVLTMAGVDMFLEVHPNVKDAVASF